jgi:hypothetical protein
MWNLEPRDQPQRNQLEKLGDMTNFIANSLSCSETVGNRIIQS